MVEIPCSPGGEAYFVQRTALGGRDFVLSFRWNQREGRWVVDLADADGAPIAVGLCLVVGPDLLGLVVDERKPAGELVVLDTSGALDADPGFDDLGGRFTLALFDPSEL